MEEMTCCSREETYLVLDTKCDILFYMLLFSCLGEFLFSHFRRIFFILFFHLCWRV